MTGLIAVLGTVLLLGFAVAVGAELDTDRQRVIRGEVARERRRRNDELRRLCEERLRLERERRRLREERELAPAHGWCADCPLWNRPDAADDGT